MNYDQQYLIEVTKSLLDIPSPAGDCHQCMDWVKKEFEKLGVTYETTRKNAVIATLPGRDDKHQILFSAHVDTLGAIVKEVKSNGRLKMDQLGGWAWSSIEGENGYVRTLDGRSFRGSVLPEMASVHIYRDKARETVRTQDNMEFRIDHRTSSKEDTANLGIEPGDLIYFDTRFEYTEAGYIKTRYLDDKACVGMVLALCKHYVENNITPERTTHFYISNYEEVGHGISHVPEQVYDFVALDIGTVGSGQESDEHAVSIAARDAFGPYDYELRKKLTLLAKENSIHYKIDLYNGYGSDASATVKQGLDLNYACIGPGVDSTHHYERTHVDSMIESMRLMDVFMRTKF